jgi:hypothetical protein
VLLDVTEQLVHRHRHRAHHHQAGKGQRHALLAAGGLDQVADAAVAGRHLRQHGADEGQRDGDLQRAVEVGHGARQADLDQHVPALGAQHAQHVFQLGLQRGQAGGDVDHDREEGDQEGREMPGPTPMPNHTTRMGTIAALGTALKPTISG